MHRTLFLCLLFIGILIPGHVIAGHGHYTSGSEGIKAATFPPEGVYWKLYNLYYGADKMKDNYKRSNDDFSVDSYVMVNRFVWSTPHEVLGAKYAMDIVIPVGYNHVELNSSPGGFSDHHFGLGDILVEPLILHWHGERWDSVVGAGLFLPTGDFRKNFNANLGLGYTTMMLTAGGTFYMDAEKTWSASALARYQIPISKQKKTHIRPGEDLSYEWGIGKNIDGLEVGVAGNSHWQVSRDEGRHSSSKRVVSHAVGPEIGYSFEGGFNVTLRSLWEYKAKNTTQGNMTLLILTKPF